MTMKRSNDGEMIPHGAKGAEDAGYLNRHSVYTNNEAFGPVIKGGIDGMHSRKSQALDEPGFDADGQWIYKHGTPYGEGAYFNALPPGMDISDQKNMLEYPMKMREYTGGLSYPGDCPWSEKSIEG